MKVDWKNWNWGGKAIFLSAVGAVASQFFAWVDIGFASQNGFEQMAFIFLIFYLYPVIKLLKGRPSLKWLSVVLAILSVISVLIYMDDKTLNFMGMTKNASGMGAVIFLLSSIGLLVGSAAYRPSGFQSPADTEEPGAFKFACSHCGQHLNAEQEHIGQTLDCPACNGLIMVQAPAIRQAPKLSVAPKKNKTGWVIGGLAAAIVVALIAVIGFSGRPTFDKADPEGSSDRMAATVSEDKRIKFAMALMSLFFQAESESQLNEALHGKTVDQIIAMMKTDEETNPDHSAETELVNRENLAQSTNSGSRSGTPTEPRPETFHQNDQESEVQHREINPTGIKEIDKVGSIIRAGDLEVTVSSLTIREEIGGGFFEARASKGGVYLVADWTYKNASRRPMSSFSKPTIRLISPDDIEYNVDIGASSARESEIEIDEKIISNLNPGITVQSTAVFEVSRELLSESGWRIQIKYDGARALFEVDSDSLLGLRPQPVATVDSATTSSGGAPELADDPTEKLKIRLADLKGELAEVDAKINIDRTRYQAAVDTINRLTNFKRTPVREGSPEYHRCLAASKVIQEVEVGAETLKTKKAQLEATIKSLGD